MKQSECTYYSELIEPRLEAFSFLPFDRPSVSGDWPPINELWHVLYRNAADVDVIDEFPYLVRLRAELIVARLAALGA